LGKIREALVEAITTFLEHLALIRGSIICALASKLGGEAKAYEIPNTQKWFG